MTTPHFTIGGKATLHECKVEIAKLNGELVHVSQQRDRLKRQVLGDTTDLDTWRARINAALAPLVEYEDGVLADDSWDVLLSFERDDRPPVELTGRLSTDEADERWEAELRKVFHDYEPQRLEYRVRATG